MRYFIILPLLFVTACEPVSLGKMRPFGKGSSAANQQVVRDANLAIESGQYDAAIEKYQMLVKASPNNMAYVVGLGDAKRRAGDKDGANSEFDKALRVNKQDASALEGKGLIMLDDKKFDQAISVFLRVLEIDALRWKSLNGLGVAYLMTENYELAVDYLSSALQTSGDSPVVMNNLGLGYAFMKDYYKSEHYLNRAAAKFASDPQKAQRAELNLALVYGIQGKGSEAERILRKYMDEAQVYNNLGIYSHLGDDNELAETYLNMALTRSPGEYTKAIENLKRIEPLVPKE